MPLSFFEFLKKMQELPEKTEVTKGAYESFDSSPPLKKIAIIAGLGLLLFLGFAHIDTVLYVALRYKDFQEQHSPTAEQQNWFLQWIFAPGAGIWAFFTSAKFSSAWRYEREYGPIVMGFIAVPIICAVAFATNYIGLVTFLSLDFFYWFRLLAYILASAGFFGLLAGLIWPFDDWLD